MPDAIKAEGGDLFEQVKVKYLFYLHGISNDPPVTFTFRNDEYEAVYWMYGGNSIDLCCCVWVDLSYDGAFLLSYCRTQINIRVRRFLDHSCLYDEILETSDPDMFIYIL